MNEDDVKPLSSNTPVRIGLVVAVMGSYTLAIWWASSVSGTLAAMDSRLKSMESSQQNRTTSVDQIDTRLKMIEQFGSPAMQSRIRELERTIDTMKKTP